MTKQSLQSKKTPSSSSSMRGPHEEEESSQSFQIRTKPEWYDFATRLAVQHGTRRSKIDGEIYELGALIYALLKGEGDDGSYAGLSPKQLARRLRPISLQLIDLLYEEGELPSLLARLLDAAPSSALQQSDEKEDNTAAIELNSSSKMALQTFPEEL